MISLGEYLAARRCAAKLLPPDPDELTRLRRRFDALMDVMILLALWSWHLYNLADALAGWLAGMLYGP